MTHKVRLADSAQDDLYEIALWIGEQSDRDTARRYVARIDAKCDTLGLFPSKGTPRDYLTPGLRSMSFERRTTIYYRIEDDEVVVVRVLRDARDASRVFKSDD